MKVSTRLFLSHTGIRPFPALYLFVLHPRSTHNEPTVNPRFYGKKVGSPCVETA